MLNEVNVEFCVVMEFDNIEMIKCVVEINVGVSLFFCFMIDCEV